MSSLSSWSTSTSAPRSRRRVTFTDSDIVVHLPPCTTSEDVSETERPQMISSTAPSSHSPTSTTSTVSTAGPYTPPSNSRGDISIEGRSGVAANSESLTPPLCNVVVPLGAKPLDTCDPHDLILHPCLRISDPIHWNMLFDPLPPRPHVLHKFGHDFMTHNAFSDPISKIQISCDILPWLIIIDIEHDGLDRPPRVEDIFNSIFVSLWKLASSVDLNNQTMERQHRILKAYQRRCRQSSMAGEMDGLRRIDFLEGQTMFLGLSPGNCDDEWHLHIGQPEESFSGRATPLR